jgi:HK97 family phage major capsid protein
MKMYSKKMRQLLKEQADAQSAIDTVMSNKNASADDIDKATEALKSATAKVNAQKIIDNDKFFDEEGQEIKSNLKKSITPNKYASMEYRQAFMDYVKFGKSSNVLEFHSEDASTGTSDVGAVIPSTILNKIISKITTHGQLYNLVRKLNVKGGLSIPILSVKPIATWISETTPSARQKQPISGNVVFNYYGLECKIATSILASIVTLDLFETTIVNEIAEAMMIPIEVGIVKGTGEGCMLGISQDTRIPAKQIVTLSSTDVQKWSSWKKNVFAKLPTGYRANATFVMSGETFDGYIDGMTDAGGQPIGRINYGITDGIQQRFGGKPVVEVEDDIIPSYDDAAVGDVIAIYGNFDNYAINTNMQMTFFHYTDHDLNQVVDKALAFVDGKVLDPNAFVVVKKGA